MSGAHAPVRACTGRVRGAVTGLRTSCNEQRWCLNSFKQAPRRRLCNRKSEDFLKFFLGLFQGRSAWRGGVGRMAAHARWPRGAAGTPDGVCRVRGPRCACLIAGSIEAPHRRCRARRNHRFWHRKQCIRRCSCGVCDAQFRVFHGISCTCFGSVFEARTAPSRSGASSNECLHLACASRLSRADEAVHDDRLM